MIKHMAIAGLLLAAGIGSSPPATAQDGGREEVTCEEEGGGAAWKLRFDWTADKVDIEYKAGGDWRAIYRGATAVRNSASDPSFLAEGTPKELAGGLGSGCGAVAETVFFDVGAKDGARAGTVERSSKWYSPSAGCKVPIPAPELPSTVVSITCR